MTDLPLYYWILEKWDGEKVKVKPSSANEVQNIITSGTGFIRTATRTINVKDVKSFDQSDIPYSDQKLLESASRAFNSELYTEIDGETFIQAKWVKKFVPNKQWENYYKKHPHYHFLEESDQGVMVAFIVPTHQIDHQRVTELTAWEVKNHKLE